MAKFYKGIMAEAWNTPIDWALLAAEQANYRHSPTIIKKISEQRKQHFQRKRKKGLASLVAAARPARQIAKVDAVATLLAAMAPGEWYGRSDMQALSGLKRGTVAGTIIKAERRGLITRTKNPAWERPGGFECEFLYRRLDQQVTHEVDDQGEGGDTATE